MKPTAYHRAFAALGLEEQQRRAPAWERFQAQGFPSRRIEDFHYTDLSALNDAEFGAAPGDAGLPSMPALEGSDVLRFVNGLRREPGESRKPEGGLADDGISALNAALYRDGLDWNVPANSRPAPLHLLSYVGHGGGERIMSHLRHRIVVGRGAQVTLVLESSGDGSESLSTVVTEIELQDGAQLELIRLQQAGAATTELARTEIIVKRDAQIRYVGLDLGGRTSRHDLNVNLAEPGAEAEICGVFAPGGDTHADTHTRVIHAAPHGTSREVFRGLVMDRARAVFNGKIVVKPGAQKTDSEQSIASLLLSPKAEVNAKPELEIYADDVKCAHGATCGQLDEDAIYYLRSRGLDETAARNVLLFTFAHEVLGRAQFAPARRALESRLLAVLPGSGSLEELL